MATPGYSDRYLEQDITTASPERILIMLFEGAIRFLNTAKLAMQKQDREKSNHQIKRAQAILTELMVSLKVEENPEVARSLYNLYEYLHYRLVEANIRQDQTMLNEVLSHLRQLKETWEEAITIAQRQNGSVPASSHPEARSAIRTA